MSVLERVLWGTAGGLFALAKAVEWWRDEREIRRIRRAHEAELAAIWEEAGRG